MNLKSILQELEKQSESFVFDEVALNENAYFGGKYEVSTHFGMLHFYVFGELNVYKISDHETEKELVKQIIADFEL